MTERHDNIVEFSPSSVDLYPINRWTANRPLRRTRLHMTISTKRPEQAWLDNSAWQDIAHDLARNSGGETAYLIDFAIDHGENEEADAFRYTVAFSDYSEHLATVQYLNTHNDAQSRIREILSAGKALEFARSSPPSIIKINVAIVDRRNRFLAIQRSGAVQTKKGIWTVGPNETMKLQRRTIPGTRSEDLFGLAERCLREELGLEPTDYGHVSISWMGYEARSACVKVFAQVAVTLSAHEVLESMAAAHGLFEAQDTAWLPLTRKNIAEIQNKWDTGDSAGRRWSSSAPVSLQELWRMHRALRI